MSRRRPTLTERLFIADISVFDLRLLDIYHVQIAPALQPLHAGGVHICLAERGEFELSGDFTIGQ